MKKECGRCKEIKSIDEFYRHGPKRQSWCKSCRKEYDKKYYDENDHRKEKIKLRRDRHKENVRKFLLEYRREHPCIDCGESDPVCLDFDHKPEFEKIDSIGMMVSRQLSLKVIKEEISKCDVRCANCHRKKTSKDFNWYSAP